jgi:formylglycine-generating enzyme required for sulfatase activity
MLISKPGLRFLPCAWLRISMTRSRTKSVHVQDRELTGQPQGPDSPLRAPELQARQGMRLVPATKFFAGIEPGSDGVEPGHEAYAGPFYIDELEVSVEQYRACTETQHFQEPS